MKKRSQKRARAVIPEVRVESARRAEREAVLRQTESISEFAGASLRSAVAFQRVQTRFHERGQAAWQHHQRTGVSVPVGEVLADLQAKPDAKRKRFVVE